MQQKKIVCWRVLPTDRKVSFTQPERFLALHEYQSDVAGDLSFTAGELVTVTDKDGEWWTGQIGNRKGIFPANYVASGDAETVKVYWVGGVPVGRGCAGR